jgi:hypothetical protein
MTACPEVMPAMKVQCHAVWESPGRPEASPGLRARPDLAVLLEVVRVLAGLTSSSLEPAWAAWGQMVSVRSMGRRVQLVPHQPASDGMPRPGAAPFGRVSGRPSESGPHGRESPATLPRDQEAGRSACSCDPQGQSHRGRSGGRPDPPAVDRTAGSAGFPACSESRTWGISHRRP